MRPHHHPQEHPQAAPQPQHGHPHYGASYHHETPAATHLRPLPLTSQFNGGVTYSVPHAGPAAVTTTPTYAGGAPPYAAQPSAGPPTHNGLHPNHNPNYATRAEVNAAAVAAHMSHVTSSASPSPANSSSGYSSQGTRAGSSQYGVYSSNPSIPSAFPPPPPELAPPPPPPPPQSAAPHRSNPFANVQLKKATTNDRSAPHIH